MGASIIGNLDSQVWKMLGLDVEDINDMNNNQNNEEEYCAVKENKRETEEERLRRD